MEESVKLEDSLQQLEHEEVKVLAELEVRLDVDSSENLAYKWSFLLGYYADQG